MSMSIKDGSERWRISLTEEFGSSQPYFGFSSSALLDGDRLVVEGGGPDGKSFASLDKKTGKVLWTSGEAAREPSYNSAI